jgi:hypothetical protein
MDVRFTGDNVTFYGGMALLLQATEALGVRQTLRAFLAELIWEYSCDTANLLVQLIALRIMAVRH